MPKVVSAQDRRRAVGEAVVRVVRRVGVEGATLGNVATEAGLAIGSVRHYFDDHESMLIFAMRELGERIGGRVAVHVDQLLTPGAEVDRRGLVEDLLAEFLPLDERRRDEAVVWLEFAMAARTRAALRATADAQHASMRALITRVLREAAAVGGLPGGLDLDVESLRLSALLDGLTVQAVLYEPPMSPRLLRDALRRALEALRRG
nr:TetR family transcriptional regulator C-terminal domain-containing protein [Kibdelosporangium sp. MJ126-NF4]CEL13797.1 Transcriptional regulator, TetR family [Kibdelosporangium sp. MJ126-NF4]CTQ88165.1 Transcriptional regulator, TetR family [Kibdelosporangium sp. MJ126-NF4]